MSELHERYYVGRLCGLGHRTGGLENSLRFRRGRRCVECSKLHSQTRDKEQRKLQKRAADLQQRLAGGPVHTVGPICKKGHRLDGMDCSARYTSGRQCIQCMSERRATAGKSYYEANAERLRAKARAYHHDNRDRQLAKIAAYRASGKARESSKRYLSNPDNKAKVRAHTAAWKKSPRGRSVCRLHDQKRRAAEKATLHVPYTVEELQARFDLFRHACAYCGSTTRLTIDHVVPVSLGGADAVSNIVPACRSCNASKGARQAWEWYHAHSHFCEARWARIARASKQVPQGRLF